jgi:PPOX class probable F420-dependent enzyme
VLEVPDSHRDLLGAEIAALTTIDNAGFPASSAVWFLYDEGAGEVGVSLNTSRLKTRNLQARPQCSLFILDPQTPYRYLEIRGRARLEPDDDYSFAGRVGAK